MSIAFRTESLTFDLTADNLCDMIGAEGKIYYSDLRLVSGIEAEFRCFRRSIHERGIHILVADEIRFEILSCRIFDEEADIVVGFGQG